MSDTEFLNNLNAHAIRRGYEPITESVLQDWVVKGVMPKAIPYGRRKGQLYQHWERDCFHYKRALFIARIKKQGTRDYSAIRIHLWLKGCDDVDFDLVREDMGKEFSKAIRYILKPMISEFDPRSNQNFSATRKRALRKQMGPLSPLLPDLGLSNRELIHALQNAVFAESENLPLNLSRVAPQLDFSQAEQLWDHLFGGLLGNPDEIENSSMYMLKKADQAAFILARDLLKYFPMGLQIAWDAIQQRLPDTAFNHVAVNQTMYRGRWQLSLFIMLLNFVYRDFKSAQVMLKDIRSKNYLSKIN